MKKIILVLTLALLLTGCSAADNGLAKNERVLSKEEFKNCYNIVTLTPDNWKDYIEIGEFTDSVEDITVLTYDLKEEYKNNLCGSPEIDITFVLQYQNKSGEYNSDTGALINEWRNEEETDTFEEYCYPKSKSSRNADRYYGHNYITFINEEYDNGYDDWRGISTKTVYQKDIKDISVSSIKGSLCYANIADDMYNTNSLNERYICFENESGTRYSLFENGLVRWDRGSGFGYYNYEDIYQTSYFDFFED